MKKFYHVTDLLSIAEEMDHLLALVNTPPVSSEQEIFTLLDALTSHLKSKVPEVTARENLKEVISAWIDDRIREKEETGDLGLFPGVSEEGARMPPIPWRGKAPLERDGLEMQGIG